MQPHGKRGGVQCGFLAFLLLVACCSGCLPVAHADHQNQTEPIHIAGLYDLGGFPWAEEILAFTAELIHDHSDGWFDEVLRDTSLIISMTDTACDPDVGVRAYLDVRLVQPHAILGSRCSGPSIDIARLVAAENRIMVSPTASSTKLSNNKNYPTFSRMVGPDNHQGQVGALVKLLRSFDWTRISIISSDTTYTRDLQAELSREWEGIHDDPEDPFVGEIGYKGTVQTVHIDEDTEAIDPVSVENVLRNVPVDNPRINSRVIVLIAHHHHAFPILKTAQEMGFQKDTIWIGLDAWTDRQPSDEIGGSSWMPPIPGYIGLTPFRNRTSPVYQDFLQRLRTYQERQNKVVWDFDLPDAADRTVDAVLAIAMAMSNVAPQQRRNGTLLSSVMRNLTFDGVSGWVEFNQQGDAADPKFTIMTKPRANEDWIPIGVASPTAAKMDKSKICFAGSSECSLLRSGSIPSDKYPIPRDPFPRWSLALMYLSVILAAILIVVMYMLRNKWKKANTVTEQLKLLEAEIGDVDAQDSSVRRRKGRLYKEFARLLRQPAPWPDGAEGLVSVEPTEKEYWDVYDKLRETMDEECHISGLQRVQNDGIWSYYVFRKNQLANKYDTHLSDQDTLREIDVWHGTSSLNPDVIHTDHQHGFMMQYSLQGLYGRGIYFSERSGYSDCYSYRVNRHTATDSNSNHQADREMFLVKLLVGRAKELDHKQSDLMREYCNSLVIPPEGEDGQPRYDAVTGESDCLTKIHVVYDNGRAYPQYLVRYYKGSRDPSRTPFDSFKDAIVATKKQRRRSRSFSLNTESTAKLTESQSDIEMGKPLVALSEQAPSTTIKEEDEQGALKLEEEEVRPFPAPQDETSCSGWVPRSEEMPPVVDMPKQEEAIWEESPGLGSFPAQQDETNWDSLVPAHREMPPAVEMPAQEEAVWEESQVNPIAQEDAVWKDSQINLDGMLSAQEEAIWEYENDQGGWVSYSEEMQPVVERVYQVNPHAHFPFELDSRLYEIDLGNKSERNLGQPDQRQRKIRRRTH